MDASDVHNYLNSKRGVFSTDTLDIENYDVTRKKLKVHENNLKIAVGNILLGILTLYNTKKKTSGVTSKNKLGDKEESKRDDQTELRVGTM